MKGGEGTGRGIDGHQKNNTLVDAGRRQTRTGN